MSKIIDAITRKCSPEGNQEVYKEYVIESLIGGWLVMLPQNYYSDAIKMVTDEDGDSFVFYATGEKIDDETIDILTSEDGVAWFIVESAFKEKTLEAFLMYFDDDEDVYAGPLKTDCTCKRCGNNTVVVEESLDYPYYCYTCDENMYSFEVEGGEPSNKCAEYIEDESSVDTRFYNILCPDGSGVVIELEVALLTNETNLCWMDVVATIGTDRVFSSSQCIGEWEPELGLSHTIDEEYLTISVDNSDKRATLQIKVQKDEPGIIFDLFKYERTPTTDTYTEREEEIVEALGYLTMEDCHGEDEE